MILLHLVTPLAADGDLGRAPGSMGLIMCNPADGTRRAGAILVCFYVGSYISI